MVEWGGSEKSNINTVRIFADRAGGGDKKVGHKAAGGNLYDRGAATLPMSLARDTVTGHKKWDGRKAIFRPGERENALRFTTAGSEGTGVWPLLMTLLFTTSIPDNAS